MTKDLLLLSYFMVFVLIAITEPTIATVIISIAIFICAFVTIKDKFTDER